jgi:glycerol-3-phosphate dehydrogenase
MIDAPPPDTWLYDVAVVGGGINGAGIARDAAGRGLSVLLCEQDDLASHTSSASSKLIHGGLRYLEHYEFSLVAHALAEREVLLRNAPHIVRPLRFVLPHVPGLRPRWMMRLGLFLYDHLDLRRDKLLAGSRHVRLADHPAGPALRPEYVDAYEYSDAWVDDARLVVLSALDAAERGATILTRTRCARAAREAGEWRLDLEGASPGTVRARVLVNASGPWVGTLLRDVVAANQPPEEPVRLVKGSHIVVPRRFDHRYAYIFQNPDRRVVFALPYEREFTLIGTTELDFTGDPASATIDDAEVAYLCETANRFFERPTRPDEVVHSFSGVRPLVGDEQPNASAVSRDYRLELDRGPAGDAPPLLSVIGGKITTYRRLGEEAVDRLAPLLDCSAPAWTSTAPLPGGDVGPGGPKAFEDALAGSHAWLPAELRRRFARSYGTRTLELLGTANSMAGLGEELGAGLTERELRYLVDHEWARTPEDVLWRRTRLGLRADAAMTARVERWLDRELAARLGGPARAETAAPEG